MSSISIIIPVYNDSKRLAACLESLCKQLSHDDDVEVIVVDNDGGLSSELDESKFLKTKFLMEKEPGSYAARNKGINCSRGQWLVFTDADCLIVDGWWEGVKRKIADTSADFLVGGVEVFPVNQDSPGTCEFYDMLFAFPIRDLFDNRRSGVTAHLIANRQCFEKYGLFDNRLFSGADNMWCRQAYAKGARAEYLDGLFVRHPARNSLKQLMLKVRRIAGGKAQRSQLHDSEPLRWIAVLKAFFPSIRQLKKIWGSPLASAWLKLKTSILASFLRTYRAWHELRYKIGAARSFERQ